MFLVKKNYMLIFGKEKKIKICFAKTLGQAKKNEKMFLVKNYMLIFGMQKKNKTSYAKALCQTA